MRVLVAISGGVDSTVAAARLIDAGHQVTGVHLMLWGPSTLPGAARPPESVTDAPRLVNTLVPEKRRPPVRGKEQLSKAAVDAQRVASELGIPLLVWDYTELFAERVLRDFLAEYEAGRTPNPCLRCNQTIKFQAVFDQAQSLGFDAVATGHYARTEQADGQVRLYRSASNVKDQSYVLGVLNQDQLQYAIFPLGEVEAKQEVREEAARRGLFVAEKPDSTDICFIPDGDTAGYLRAALGVRPGRIVTENGEVLGSHDGAYQFTVGQRHGLKLSQPAADGQPRYVVRVSAKSNEVVVGPRTSLIVNQIVGEQLTWTGEPVASSWRGLAQWRAHHLPVSARFIVEDNGLRVVLDEPAFGVAPGQRLVMYDGERVVGSAVITEASA